MFDLALPLLGVHGFSSASSVKSRPRRKRGGEGAYEKLITPGIMQLMPDSSLAAVVVCFLFFPSYGDPKRHLDSFRLA